MSGLRAVLAEIEARLSTAPDTIALRFDRARCLDALGDSAGARAAFADVVARDPAHGAAHAALGKLALRAGDYAGARAAFARAVALVPGDAPAHASLGFALLRCDDVAGARAEYEAALRIDPVLALAHHGLVETLERLGDAEGAARHRALGVAHRPVTTLRYEGDGVPIRLLVVGSSQGGNLVIAGDLDRTVFAISALVVEAFPPGSALPAHDLVFNAIGEADRSGAALDAAAALLRGTGAPVINPPGAVRASGRAANAERLRAIPGVLTPTIVPVRKALGAGGVDAARARHGIGYPFLLRSPGYHTGLHFVLVPDASALADALETLPGDELLCIEHLDARGPDGKARKYRAMFVDGAIYPLHAAISDDWKVHYFSAQMQESAAHRAEDAAFLRDMPGAIGPRASAALERICDALALDYAGVDFGLDADGNVLLFEANASMVVPLPGPEPIWDYRREPVGRVRDAVRAMLIRRGRGETTGRFEEAKGSR